MKVAVAQFGARMHYAVPRIFSEAGSLETLFTDLCASKGMGRLTTLFPRGILPDSLKKLSARRVQQVPKERIVALDKVGLEYWWKLKRVRSKQELAHVHLWAGEAFAAAIIKHGLGKTDTVYTFNSSGLKLMEYARNKGLKTIHEQAIAPVSVQMSLMKEEYQRWPEWENNDEFDAFYHPFLENETQEWTLADTILCGSEFVRDSIKQSCGPTDRAIVVPYGVDMPQAPKTLNLKKKLERPLRVLTVGTVCLRKGAPYVAETARRLKGLAEFRVAGGIELKQSGRQYLSTHAMLLGPVPRNEMAKHFEWADVFYLPTLCEGSATATYEALAWGLPVITTANAGSPIQDKIEGYILSIRDINGACQALTFLATDNDLRRSMSYAAKKRHLSLTVSVYSKNLLQAIGQ